MDARALGPNDNLGGTGWGEEPPGAVAGKVFVQWSVIAVANWNDLMDAYPAKHIEDLIAYADGVEQITGLHSGSPEAGL
jgi:hypothetical protein